MLHQRYSIAVILCLLLLAGCSAQFVSRNRTEIALPKHSRIALIPFENLSGKEKAGQKITEYFQTLMAGEGNFDCEEYGQTLEAMRKYRIRTASTLTTGQIDSLSAALQVAFLLTGSVLEYDEFDNTYLGKVPQVSFDARLIDCTSHKTIWVSVSNGSGDQGELVFGIGAVRSADQLAENLVSKSINKLASLFTK